MNYNKLIKSIESIHLAFFKQAVNAVNINLTLRNWFIGYHIVEFEQKGADRAEYGTKLLESIAESISIKGLSKTNLKLCRQFYNVYPEIYSILPEDVLSRLPLSIRQSATDLLQLTNSETNIIGQSPTDQFELTQKGYIVNLIKTTSFTHFVELVSIDDPVKRKFYELLIIKTTPSVKELKVNEFESTHASQLNTYLNFYKKNIMEGSDNPPVGILLVANKNNALVEYATAGMDSNLFVSKYLLQLPDKKQFEEFLNNELKKL